MLRAALLVVALVVSGCGGSDDCAERLADGRPIPAEGCCTDGGFCVAPPKYDPLCSGVSADECSTVVYSPVYEGGPTWVLCDKQPWDVTATTWTVCPVAEATDG